MLIIGVLVVLATSCPVSDFVHALITAYTPENATINQTQPALNSTDNQTNKTEEQWGNITKNQAEKGCLKQAKKVATDKGYSDAMVFSCTCPAQETSTTKSYDCTVSALDGEHKVTINCIKAENKCAVTSEEGTSYYNFNELEKFAN